MKIITVPGEIYITEFENKYQDIAEGRVHCEGVATMWNGSIHDGIITHAVYLVTITPENFRSTGDHMFAVSSQEKLICMSRGDVGAPGCEGSLYTYAWSPPKTKCEFREIRSVKGKIGRFDFLAKEGELYYEITGTQVMPLACGGNTIFVTNVRNIMIALKREVHKSNMKLLKPEERLMRAEARALALFEQYKLTEAERKKKSLGWEFYCEFKTQEPLDAPPHHIGDGIYVFRR